MKIVKLEQLEQLKVFLRPDSEHLTWDELKLYLKTDSEGFNEIRNYYISGQSLATCINTGERISILLYSKRYPRIKIIKQ